MNWALFLLLQPCDTHEDQFKTKFNLEKNKMAVNKRKPCKRKFWG